jgi:hypothetical protein
MRNSRKQASRRRSKPCLTLKGAGFSDVLPDYRNIIVYNGINRFQIPNGYGENDWRIYLSDSLLAKFRHIKTNRNNGHEYHFFVFQYAGKWFVDVDIRGTDAVQRRIEFHRSSETRFKSWLRDTLNRIGANPKDRLMSSSVYDDSLMLEIKKSFSIQINPEAKPQESELVYALDLLESNNVRPAGSFKLEFDVKLIYTNSIVDQLQREFSSEVTKCDVTANDTVFSYRFIKGNLVAKDSRLFRGTNTFKGD